MRSVLVLAAALVLSACGESSETGSSAKTTAVPPWAKVAPEQIEAARKAGVPVAFEDSLGMRFVLIPAGTFTMGSPATEAGPYNEESPQHAVTLSKPYYLAVTEVTQAVWEAVIGSNPSRAKGLTLPVTDVSWDDGQSFLQRVNASVPGGGYRLPTEAEWEYACRAGSRTAFCFGDDEGRLSEYAWYIANSGGATHPVGLLKPNAWGLLDMHGTVWEWCQDAYGSYPVAPVTDPMEASGSDRGRVFRGGCWNDTARLARSAIRYRAYPDFSQDNLGLRLARAVTAK